MASVSAGQQIALSTINSKGLGLIPAPGFGRLVFSLGPVVGPNKNGPPPVASGGEPGPQASSEPASMSTVATAPPVRHGHCRWSVYIATDGRTGGKYYAVTPIADQPGFRGVWRVRAHGTETTYTVAAPKTGRPGCTCPDHETRGTACKHIMALAALGL